MADGMISDPFAPLDPNEMDKVALPLAANSDWVPMVPAPGDPPEVGDIRHARYGNATGRWIYRDEESRTLFAAVRFEKPDGGKEVLPFSFGVQRGQGGWHFKRPAGPIPLYGLDRLAARPGAPVLLVEGEKAADSAAALFPRHVVMTWQGGANSVSAADWRSLAHRRVTIWPDNDIPGARAAASAATYLRRANAAAVCTIEVPSHWPQAWDLADTPPPGVGINTLREMVARIEQPVAVWAKGYLMRDDGLYWQPDDREKPEHWLAARFLVECEVRSADGDGWGLLLSWQDRDARRHRWVVPMRSLIGDPGAIEAELMDRGLSISPGQAQRARLREALSTVRTDARVKTVARTGWHQGPESIVYIVPGGEVIGQTAEPVVLHTGSAGATESPGSTGTLEGWQAEVAALGVDNPFLALFLAAAFAPPLVDITGDKSGGFHLFGRSQSGKTTLLRCAASVWGAPDMGAVLKSWRATANGLEAVAAEACDALLPLDEISSANDRDIAEVVYLLGNESGKRRANRDGGARKSKTWRLLFLSTGEIDLEAKLAEGGKRLMAGQEVRMVSLPLPAGGPVSGNLHGQHSPTALLVNLNEAVKRQHGTAARIFLTKLTASRTEDPVALAAFIDNVRHDFLDKHVPPGADGQVVTVARRFALVAAAGALARCYGVVPWPDGEAERAASACFKIWLARRNGAGAAEENQVVGRMRHFIALHGASRFDVLDESDERLEARTVNRAGWKRRDAEGRWEYLILPTVWAKEVFTAMDGREAANCLRDRGLLRAEERGRFTIKHRIPGHGRPRVYMVTGGIFDDAGEEN